jgi:hypothetical protein
MANLVRKLNKKEGWVASLYKKKKDLNTPNQIKTQILTLQTKYTVQ